ncbi:amidohydrolase family protein [Photobacterium makurazakiensis]|uniref:amidohydrolase n=1 Tax=Photobacterium makurazakiensis TaxID=2910234 RepID=UPI003D09CBB0
MKAKTIPLATSFILASAALTAGEFKTADTIYSNAKVITMDSQQAEAESIAIKDGKIVLVGSDKEVSQLKGGSTKVIDVEGKTIVPGFIDSHGHFSIVAQTINYANVSPSPVGSSDSIPELINEMKRFWQKRSVNGREWLIGTGYDDSLLAEKVHPTRHDLDKISSTQPVVIIHASYHLAVVNTKGLELLGFDESTPDPTGGKIVREPSSRMPNGVLEETAMKKPLGMIMTPEANVEKLIESYKETQHYYASFGITTAQDGAASYNTVKSYEELAKNNTLYLDIAAYPTWDAFAMLERKGYKPSKNYENNFRIAGIKLVLDGSPQGRTAFMTQPYKTPPKGSANSYVGYPTLERDFLISKLGRYVDKGYQFIVHTNGDASVDMYLDALEAVTDESTDLGIIRPVSIHSQTTRDDQLVKMAKLEMIPSFFSAHTYFWGDWHNDVVFGEQRAQRISPTKSATKLGIPYTTHNDAPVVDPDMLRLMFNTVNRVTRSGKILGKDQQATPYEALASITINAAYQNHEEASKGSITPGKLADLVILSDNPLTVERSKIADITILETLKAGQTVYVNDVI